jgi:transglutaminase-like putative cysteine protease
MIRSCARTVVPRIRMRRVERGFRGTLTTARMIADLILDGARDFVVRQTAIGILRRAQVPAKDRFGEARALFEWVRSNVRYTRDIFRVELLHSARRMLELRAGDCDDMTILLSAMLLSTGHPVRLVLAGFQPHRPHAYSHIYPEVHVGGRWIAVDTTLGGPMGTAPPALWRSECDIRKEGVKCWSRII